MSLVVGSGAIDAGNSYFRVRDNNTNVILEQGVSTFGYSLQKGVPGFVAGASTDFGWLSYSGWNSMSTRCTVTPYNNGNYYDPTTGRFNVPVSGPYLFIFTAYTYTDTYLEPMFYVNGSGSTRRGGNSMYRIRGYGFVSGYPQDLQMEETIYCLAGDYVEPYCYAAGSSYQYPAYSCFMGVYVG
jgi:hypothetical protein